MDTKTYGFFALFPTRIYSCKVGASKPNPIIYKEALKTCKVKAQEAAYIDDIPAYAQAAAQLGMQWHRVSVPRAASVRPAEQTDEEKPPEILDGGMIIG